MKKKGKGSRAIEAQSVVLAVGLSSDRKIYESLTGKHPEVYEIGDCSEPLNIMGAIWDGYEVGRSI